MDSLDISLIQVNRRIANNLIIIPKDLFFDVLQILFTTNIFQIHRLIMQSEEKNGLLLYIREFLGKQKIIKFTKHNLTENCHWNFKEYLNIFLDQFPKENKLSCVEIENPFKETILDFRKFNITNLYCKHIRLINLMVNELFITQLTFINVSGNGNKIGSFIKKCKNLIYLHLDDYDLNFLFLSDIKKIHLKTFKLTGILYHDYSLDDVAVFLKGQASSLEKITLKINNNPNFIHNIHLGKTVFPKLIKLNILHTHFISVKIPKVFINQINSICLISRCLTKNNIKNILSQLENKKNINSIKFATNTLLVSDYLELLNTFQHENSHCTIVCIKNVKKH